VQRSAGTAVRREAATRAAVAASVACLCFGASVVATRYVVVQTSPVVLACLRYSIAAACMAVVFRARAFPPMAARDRAVIVALGVLFFGVFPWSFSASLTHLPSAQVALIVATNPLVTLLLSRLRGIERITSRAMVGQLIAFGGLALALPRPTGGVMVAADAWQGYLEIGITVLCGAAYNVWSRPMLMRYGALPVTSLGMVAGAAALAPLALAAGFATHVRTITPAGWGAVLFLGTLGGAVGFGLWAWALERSTPSRVAVFLALNPITAIALGALLLGEPVTLRLLLGLAAVLAGIQVVSRARVR
jgi:drug/metabolite transporter (DMT)-like permease